MQASGKKNETRKSSLHETRHDDNNTIPEISEEPRIIVNKKTLKADSKKIIMHQSGTKNNRQHRSQEHEHTSTENIASSWAMIFEEGENTGLKMISEEEGIRMKMERKCSRKQTSSLVVLLQEQPAVEHQTSSET